MKRYVEGENRSQSTLFPERLDDYIGEDNPVRVVDVFVDEMNLKELSMSFKLCGLRRNDIPNSNYLKPAYENFSRPRREGEGA